MGCDSIVKAFLYWECSYQSGPANPASLTVTNPASANFPYSVPYIGLSVSQNWSDIGTVTYRADITNAISGNGKYTFSITGAGNSANEMDGLSLIVIYRDYTAKYSGNLVLYDGCDAESTSFLTVNYTGGGFNVCSATSKAKAFALFGDMQANIGSGTNTETFNGSTETFSNNFWNFDTISTSLTTGQSSITYNTYTNDLTDCYGLNLAGLYWQDTNCVICSTGGSFNVTPSQVNPACGVANGSASVTVTGGAPPYTYIWSTGDTTSSISGVDVGWYSVIVKDMCGHLDTATFNLSISGYTASITTTNPTCTKKGTAMVTPVGGIGPFTYSWSNGSTNQIDTGLVAGSYSVTITNDTGCAIFVYTTLYNPPLPTIKISPAIDSICPGGNIICTASGGKTYVWAPSSSLNCSTCATPNATPSITTTYTVTGADSNGCTNTATTVISIAQLPTVVITPAKDSICPGGTAHFTASGAADYTWLPTTGLSCTNCANTSASVNTKTTYTVTGTNAFGCTSTATSTVTILPVPKPVITAGKDSICEGSLKRLRHRVVHRIYGVLQQA